MQNHLLSIQDLSDQLNIKSKTIYAKAEAGEIPCYRICQQLSQRLRNK
jgi:excisionase family DNA binding protein